MSSIGRHNIEIGLCPSLGKQMAHEWRTPVDMSTSYDEETNRLTVTIRLLKQNRIKPNRILTVYLCPQGEVCGCSYDVDVGWEIGETLCDCNVYWTWPSEASCLLKSGSLTGGVSGLHFTEELSGDPDWPIYPVGDDRNPDCPGCGMSGADRETTVETPVPGEQFSLSGCIREETCVGLYGPDGCHPIGSARFETVGFMGGRINSIIDVDSRLYGVLVGDIVINVQGTDLTNYSIGDWVALAKVDTEFPVDEFGYREAVTNVNVPRVDEYIIVPYAFQGE